MNKKLLSVSVLFAGSMIINSVFGANLERNSTKREHDTELETQNSAIKTPCLDFDDRTFKFNTPEELNEFITHDKLSALSVNDLIELAGDVKQLSSPRYANHDFFSSEMISDALDKILIEIRNKERDLHLNQNNNFDNLIYAYQDNRYAWPIITSDRIDDKKYAFSKFNNTIKYLQCFSQLDNTIKSDLIKHLARERDKSLIDYCENMKSRSFKEYCDCHPDAIIENPIQELMQLANSIKYNFDKVYSDGEITSILDKIFTTLTENSDFKFENHYSLEYFIRAYYEHKGSMHFITSKLSEMAVEDLLKIAYYINGEYSTFEILQDQDRKLILNKIFTTLTTNRDFKFKTYDNLRNFTEVYHMYEGAIEFITSDRLSNMHTNDLFKTVVYIEEEYSPFAFLQNFRDIELILNEIFTALADRNFKFETYNHLSNFILEYCKYEKAIDIITSDRLSNINANDLIKIAHEIKTDNCYFAYWQDRKKELILNEIFTALTDSDFKFETCNHLLNFILEYCKYEKAIDIITSDKLSNINTNNLLATAICINGGFGPLSNLQDHEKKLILSKIFAAITDINFKFKNHYSLECFIVVYHEYEGAMDTIISKLSEMAAEDLLKIAAGIKREVDPFSNLQDKEKELILNQIFTILKNRDFKFENCDNLENFIRAYHESNTAIEFITPNRLSKMSTNDLFDTTCYIIEFCNTFLYTTDQCKKLIANKIITALSGRFFRFMDSASLTHFVFACHEYENAVDFITSDRLSYMTIGQLEYAIGCIMEYFVPLHMDHTEKKKIKYIIGIISHKLHQISWQPQISSTN